MLEGFRTSKGHSKPLWGSRRQNRELGEVRNGGSFRLVECGVSESISCQLVLLCSVNIAPDCQSQSWWPWWEKRTWMEWCTGILTARSLTWSSCLVGCNLVMPAVCPEVWYVDVLTSPLPPREVEVWVLELLYLWWGRNSVPFSSLVLGPG